MKHDQNRMRKHSLTDLARRFQLTAEDVLDPRIDSLLRRKAALDEEVRKLLATGAREARILRTAKLLGFTEQEVAGDHNKIAWMIKSILDSRQLLATLKPKTVKPGDTNVSK